MYINLILQALLFIVNYSNVNADIPMEQIAVQLDSNNIEMAQGLAKKHNMKYLTKINDDGLFLFGHTLDQNIDQINLKEHRRRRRAAIDTELNDEEHIQWSVHQDEQLRVKRDINNLIRQKRQRSKETFNDPLFPDQWYMNQGAQNGYTLNLDQAWSRGYTGKGVHVTILDDGVQADHPDLQPNFDFASSTDLNSFDADPTPQANRKNAHGTRCASVVASVANNGICTVGIAYNASIGGVRMLDGAVTDAIEASAVGLNQNHVDIFSASWGPDDGGRTWDGPGPLTENNFKRGADSGRNGKGNIYVWASGNGAHKGDSCSYDGYSTSIYTMSIASASYRNEKPWYSEECPSVIAVTYSSGDQTTEPQVCAADVPRGCTRDHTGTSASAPMAAGIVALMLQANPQLTWRDVQHIVARSSNPAPLLSNQGWMTNGAGFKVSSKFGFGVMDAGRATQLAERWKTVPGQKACKVLFGINEEAQQLRGSVFRNGKNYGLDIADECANVQYLEHVLLTLDAPYVFNRGAVQISLTSPMGTTSMMLPARPKDTRLNTYNESKRWPVMSVQQWGERPVGRWLLNVQDVGEQWNSNRIMLEGITLTLYGTTEQPPVR